MRSLFPDKKDQVHLVLLFTVLLAGAILRFYHLSFQSLWLDELHTMIECDPKLEWKDLFRYLHCCDLQPPFYYLLERGMFTVFGYDELTARLLSAFTGVASIIVMYFLGKELSDKRLGLIAALLTCVNYFHIYYSQEARGYMLFFLCSAVSFLLLVRLIRKQSVPAAICYGISTLAMIYTHYYGLFAYIAQLLIAFIVLLTEPAKRRYIRFLLPVNLAVMISYLPWIPFLLDMTKVRSYWIESVSPGFAIDFFFEYFGNSDLLKPCLLLILTLYAAGLTRRAEPSLSLKQNPHAFSFMLFACWIFTVYFIPYLRSVTAVPILYPRYTIVVLPAFICMLSMGIEVIPNRYVKYTVLTLLVVLSLTDILLVKKYYTAINKTQFREMTAYIASHNREHYPIINERTAWHEDYYLRQSGSESRVLTGSKEGIIDSVLARKSGYDLPVFWLIGAHGDPRLSDEKTKLLEQDYMLVREKAFYDAWAQLYLSIRAGNSEKIRVIRPDAFKKASMITLDGDEVIALWDVPVLSEPIRLPQGRYKLTILSKGTDVDGIFPHVIVKIGSREIGGYNAGKTFESASFSFIRRNDSAFSISLGMDNDIYDPVKKQDRNAFVKMVLIEQLGASAE